MRTRCPDCNTVFRVTSEQLRLKAGKVRCGHCQAVFNAFEALIEAPVQPSAIIQSELPVGEDNRTEPSSAPSIESPSESLRADQLAAENQTEPVTDTTGEAFFSALPSRVPEVEAPIASLSEVSERVAPVDSAVGEKRETTEESTLAAREAGLVAARELSDLPGQSHNRWAAGTLAGTGLGSLEIEPQRRILWPFVVVALLLMFGLAAQLLFHFRTAVVQRLPAAAEWYEMAAVDIPLPQNSELVAIDASDLQSDNTRGLFVLQASLRNRASYPQRWPALELTLTDTTDTVVARRVLQSNDYLPPAIDPAAFPANGEVAVKLWIEAKDIGAAGYRLYVFYP